MAKFAPTMRFLVASFALFGVLTAGASQWNPVRVYGRVVQDNNCNRNLPVMGYFDFEVDNTFFHEYDTYFVLDGAYRFEGSGETKSSTRYFSIIGSGTTYFSTSADLEKGIYDRLLVVLRVSSQSTNQIQDVMYRFRLPAKRCQNSSKTEELELIFAW